MQTSCAELELRHDNDIKGYVRGAPVFRDRLPVLGDLGDARIGGPVGGGVVVE